MTPDDNDDSDVCLENALEMNPSVTVLKITMFIWTISLQIILIRDSSLNVYMDFDLIKSMIRCVFICKNNSI